MKGAFSLQLGCDLKAGRYFIESSLGEAIRILLEENLDIVKTVSKISPFLRVAEEKGFRSPLAIRPTEAMREAGQT